MAVFASTGKGRLTMTDDPNLSDPRAGVFDRMRAVARPDSRLHYDFAHMHPDFEGNDAAAERILDVEPTPSVAFVVPDGAAVAARERLLHAGTRLIVSTFRMRRGFRMLDPAAIDPRDFAFAATLDGIERFGQVIDLARLSALGKVDLVLTGTAAVSVNGSRFGRFYQYFDFEWGLLSDIGLVNDRTPVGVIAHDFQVIDRKVVAMPREPVADYIFTPTRLLRIIGRPRRPVGIDWEGIDPDELELMPALIELHRARGLRR